MLSVKRLEEITKVLEKEGSVDVNSLCERFKVTGKTIRQDLAKLEEIGLLERHHGGAILKQNQNSNSIFPIKQRKQHNLAEKERIAEAAQKHIEERDIIIIDGGSTNFELAKELGDKQIIVITNDVLIVGELLNKENVTLYVTGGELRREGIFTLVGRDAEKMVQKYNANKLFLATSALDFKQGLTVFSAEEAELKRVMISSVKEVICLADYSKFHQLAFASFASLDEIDILITDDRITDEDQAFLHNNKIKLEVV
jgi:DeoR family transcriptional regulator, fructose operon transcriptional repressor